jgi:peptidoglycan/LPS O-acetylase OafA/YrhL
MSTYRPDTASGDLPSGSAVHRGSRLSELDALRGLAAVTVMLFHLTSLADRQGLAPFRLGRGHYGVELFFIISGFVIFMTIARCSGLREFAISRFARLYPAYWCGALLTAAAVCALESQPVPLAEFAVNLTMLQAFLGVLPVDGSYWTLAVELQFYVAIGTIFALGLIRHIEAFCIAALVAAHATRFAMAWFGLTLPYSPPAGLFYYGGFFVIGICLFRLRGNRGSWSARIALLLAVLYPAWGGTQPSGVPAPVQYLTVTCVLTILVWLAVNGHARLLRWRPLVFLGGISYPLYLVHQCMGKDLVEALHRAGLSDPAALLGSVLCVTLLAIAIHAAVEDPGRRRIRRVLAPGRRVSRLAQPGLLNAPG